MTLCWFFIEIDYISITWCVWRFSSTSNSEFTLYNMSTTFLAGNNNLSLASQKKWFYTLKLSAYSSQGNIPCSRIFFLERFYKVSFRIWVDMYSEKFSRHCQGLLELWVHKGWSRHQSISSTEVAREYILLFLQYSFLAISDKSFQ